MGVFYSLEEIFLSLVRGSSHAKPDLLLDRFDMLTCSPISVATGVSPAVARSGRDCLSGEFGVENHK